MRKSNAVAQRTAVTMGVVALGALSGALQAQESLAGVGVASGISSSMSGMSSSGAVTAGQRAPRSADAIRAGASSDLTQSEIFGASGSPGAGEGGSGGQGAAAAPVRMEPRRWNPKVTGQSLLSELLAARQMPKIPSPIGKSRSPLGQAKLSSKIKGMDEKQRKQLVMQKYDIRPKNWLVHYLHEDRYKISSGTWNFVTTRTSRFYYRPWSMAMLKADSNHVIGFRTWQDAMMAGYRPDPVSRPEPAAQIADLAALTRGDALTRYVEFVYSGQITPVSFSAHYKYIKQVAQIVRSYQHTRPLLGKTVDQILLASLGEGSLPTSVGGPPPAPMPVNGAEGSGSGGMMTGSSSNSGMAGLQAGNTDKRSEEFSGFSSRAGSLANVPANR